MKKYARIFLRSVYYIFPKFIRNQYIESVIFYSALMKSISNKNNNEEENIINVKLVSHIEELGAPLDKIGSIENRSSHVNAPELLVQDKICFRNSLSGDLPAVEIFRLKGVCILGNTDAVIFNDLMYHYELSSMEHNHDLKRPEIFEFIDDKNELIVNNKVNSSRGKIIGLSISLLKEHSINYYHFITEVLPKLLLILQNKNSLTVHGNDKKITILIDSKMPIQNEDILLAVLPKKDGLDFEIVRINNAEIIFCEELVYCTPLWISLDNTKCLPNPKKEFFVATDGLCNIKNHLKLSVNSEQSTIVNKKIYLQRANNKLRKITNILELELLMYKLGFDFIDPGSLSFEEQYNLFSQADIVIGASGAAFTNLLFMRENSIAISLYPSAQSTNYYVFQPLADVSGVRLIHVLTHPEDESNSVHGNASVDISKLETLLIEILNEKNN